MALGLMEPLPQEETTQGAGGRQLTKAGGTDTPLLSATDHTEVRGIVKPWLRTGFGGWLGLGGPWGTLGWGPTRLPGAATLGGGGCFGTEAPRSKPAGRAWGDRRGVSGEHRPGSVHAG